MNNLKIYIVSVLIILGCSLHAQKGPKIGYINMEYILENLPEYAEANRQLETNMAAWKKEVDKKKNEIDKLKQTLEAEKPLLTKEMIEDAEDEIKFQEGELFDYQQNIFGPSGVLFTQKKNLVQPIQDQVFNVIKDIAEARKYDFIFDKTADVIMLFASKRFDISDQVVRAMKRISKKEKLSKKQLKTLDEEEAKQALIEENPEKSEKQLKTEALKKQREQALEDKKKQIEDRNKEKEAQRQKLKEERLKSKVTANKNEVSDEVFQDSTATPVEGGLTKAEELKKKREQLLEDRKKQIEERNKEKEIQRQKLIEEREKAKISAKKQETPIVENETVKDSTQIEAGPASNLSKAEELKKKREQLLEERKQMLEKRKQELEEKRKKALEEREAKKIKTDSISK